MKRTYLFAWVITLLVTSFVALQAQAQEGTVSGIVRAADTGEPLPGANVTVEDEPLGASTGADGTFQLENVPVGSHVVYISFVGYRDAEREITVRSNQTLNMSVDLELSAREFQEMVVTGSRQEEKLENAPVQMEILGSDEIEAAGGHTVWAGMSTLKGIDFSRLGINRQSISMRGFDSHYDSRLVEMKDGYLTRIPGVGIPQSNYTPTSRLDVRQIEVVVGPASALYGPNAHTGVVNVLTKSPWDESGVTLSVRGGQQDLLDVEGRVAGVLGDDFGWKVTGKYMEAMDYRPPTGGPNASRADSTHFFGTSFNETELVDDYRVESIRTEGSLYYRFGDSWQIEGNYGLSINDNFDTSTFGRVRTRDLRLQYQNLEISSDHWAIRGTHTSNDGGNTYELSNLARIAERTTGSAIENEVPPSEARKQALNQVETLRDSSRWSLEGDLWDAEVGYNNTFGVGAGTIRLQTGVQVRRYAPTSGKTFLADAVGRDLSFWERGGYVQLDYRPTEALRVNTAARLDQIDEDVTFSPKASLVYSVARDHTVRLTYNRAFKRPETFQKHFFSGTIRGNDDGFVVRDGPRPGANVVRRIDPLEPEEVNSVEFGYRGTFADRLSMNLVAYNSWYSNFISPETVVGSPAPSLNPGTSRPTYAFEDSQLITNDLPNFPDGTLITYFNYAEAVVRGLDLGLTYAVRDKLTLSGSVSLIEKASFEDEGAAKPLLLNVPTTKVKGGLTIRDVGLNNYFVSVSGRWKAAHRFRAGLVWDSAQFYDDAEIPSRFSADLTVGYTVPGTGLQVKGSATNLFDTTVPDKLGAPQTGRLLTVSATYTLGAFGP